MFEQQIARKKFVAWCNKMSQRNVSFDNDDDAETLFARRVAFASIVVSTLAVAAAVITLPMLYNYVQFFQSHLLIETDYCKATSRDMWMELTALQIAKGHFGRIKRGWLFGQRIDAGAPVESGGPYGGAGFAAPNLSQSNAPFGSQAPRKQPPAQAPFTSAPTMTGYFAPVLIQRAPMIQACCTCMQGPAGPPGEEGPSGEAGESGMPGKDGYHGKESMNLPPPLEEPCLICPAGVQGPPGQQGPRGPPGPKGAQGEPPKDGIPGPMGDQGIPGPKGTQGREGHKGRLGANGRLIPVLGPQAAPGEPGPQGIMGAKGPIGVPGQSFEGPMGPPGDQGRTGHNGRPGRFGFAGPAGQEGDKGSCAHCPEPRTPPGYFGASIPITGANPYRHRR